MIKWNAIDVTNFIFSETFKLKHLIHGDDREEKIYAEEVA